MDLANDQEVDQVAKTASDTGIPLRFLGLVAAINHPAVSIENMDMAIWDRVHNVNLRANVKFISACAAAAQGG